MKINLQYNQKYRQIFLKISELKKGKPTSWSLLINNLNLKKRFETHNHIKSCHIIRSGFEEMYLPGWSDSTIM